MGDARTCRIEWAVRTFHDAAQDYAHCPGHRGRFQMDARLCLSEAGSDLADLSRRLSAANPGAAAVRRYRANMGRAQYEYGLARRAIRQIEEELNNG